MSTSTPSRPCVQHDILEAPSHRRLFPLFSPSKLTCLSADVFTTWSGGVPIDEFIKISYVVFTSFRIAQS